MLYIDIKNAFVFIDIQENLRLSGIVPFLSQKKNTHINYNKLLYFKN